MSSINFATAYIGGLLTLLAPCSAMLLPAFFAYAFNSPRQLISRTFVFYLGLLAALLPLGAVAGVVGGLFKIYFPTIALFVAILIIVIGVMQIFSIKIPMPKISFTNKIKTPKTDSTSNLGVFLLGFGYAVIGGGCSGPILGAVLASAVISGSTFVGILMMVIYALGMVTPIVLMALLWDVLRINERTWLQPRPVKLLGKFDTSVGSIISGVVFIILGLVFLFLPDVNLTQIDASTFAGIESVGTAIGLAIPNWMFILLVVVLPLLIGALVYELKKSRKFKSDSD